MPVPFDLSLVPATVALTLAGHADTTADMLSALAEVADEHDNLALGRKLLQNDLLDIASQDAMLALVAARKAEDPTVLGHPRCPAAVLETAHRSTIRHGTAGLVAANANTPAWVLRELAGTNIYPVRIAVAKNPNCPPDLLEELAGDRSPDVAIAAALNPSAGEHLFNQMLDQVEAQAPLGRDQTLRILASKATDGEQLQRVYETLNAVEVANAHMVYTELARNPATRGDTLQACLNTYSGTETYQHNLGRHHNAPPALIGWLAGHGYSAAVRRNALGRTNCPAEVLANPRRAYSVDAARVIAANPSTPAETLSRLSRHDEPEVRTIVAENLSTAGGDLDRLSRDPSINVRFAAIANPNLPAPALLEAANRKPSSVQHHALRQPRTPILFGVDPQRWADLADRWEGTAAALAARCTPQVAAAA